MDRLFLIWKIPIHAELRQFQKALKIFLLFIFLFSYTNLFAQPLPKPYHYVKDAVTIRQNTQKELDKWLEEKQRLMAQYKALEEENKELEKEIEELKKEAVLHKEAIKRIEKDLKKIEGIKQKIRPLIEDIFKKLCDFIENGIPFLERERKERIKRLRKIIKDPTITEDEKLRRLFEAIFIEAEYGNTIEVYQERIRLGNEYIYANIFRLGRVSLFFQSLDNKTVGYFDPVSGWKVLPDKYKKQIEIAIDIAEKRRPVQIIELPIGRIKR